jgi:hypothetical protein
MLSVQRSKFFNFINPYEAKHIIIIKMYLESENCIHDAMAEEFDQTQYEIHLPNDTLHFGFLWILQIPNCIRIVLCSDCYDCHQVTYQILQHHSIQQ